MYGEGFQYDGNHVPVAGTVGQIAVEVDAMPIYSVAFTIELATLKQALETRTVFQVFAARFSGDDEIEGSPFADSLYGFAGSDNIYCGAGNDVAYGGDGADPISGEAGNDVLHGGKRSDFVFGEAGNDTLTAAPARTSSMAAGGRTSFSATRAPTPSHSRPSSTRRRTSPGSET